MKANRPIANRLTLAVLMTLGGIMLAPQPATAAIYTQCPGDTDQDAVPDAPGTPANVKCKHLTSGDGFVKMADGYLQYVFGFKDVTGTPASNVMTVGAFGANFSAPTLAFDEGDEVYLNLSNVSMINRPDLADPHTVHYHGFPNAASVFDGVPESSISPMEGSTMTYYYKQYEPGTYIYHCHVEAAEHMQMGMLGNLYVRPRQNRCLDPGASISCPPGHAAGNQYAYNDGDGSTRYDVEVPLQLAGFDHNFHDASRNVQPLHFAVMRDTYPMINGRGYPDTKNKDPLPPPLDEDGQPANFNKVSQPISALVTATVGQKILLRISSLDVTRYYTVGVLGLPMKVIGTGGRQLRGTGGANMYYDTTSVTLGGGESADVLIDTTGVAAGTYFLYTTNLNYLSNNAEDFGGMMTEIVIN